MSLTELINKAGVSRVLTHPDDSDEAWAEDLTRFLSEDPELTRSSASEDAVIAIQRAMVFLGFSTSSRGAFLIDGDFGPGTNRGIAQFQFENGINPDITRAQLCYPCTFQTAHKKISGIPQTTVDRETVFRILTELDNRIAAGEVLCGDLDEALFHLNALHRGEFLRCREILEHYGDMAEIALEEVKQGTGKTVLLEWVLAIIRQESAGIVRPRFEQHKLSRANERSPHADFSTIRMESMSLGLGQIMGFNHAVVGAQSARDLYFAPVSDQIGFVARFIAAKDRIVSNPDPSESDFRSLARYYNGPKYEVHRYHEKLEKWFREFQGLV